MKKYIKTILRGGAFLEFETRQNGLDYIFKGEGDEIIPFEDNYNQRSECSDVLRESYWECSKDNSYYLQANELPDDDGIIFSLYANGKRIAMDYVKKCKISVEYHVTKKLSKKIYRKIKKLEAQGFAFDPDMKATGIIVKTYQLKNGWMFFNSEIVYARHPNSISVIARNRKEAEEIANKLVRRMKSWPKSYYTRRERQHHNREIDQYNATQECNQLKYKYFKILKEAYEKRDFSEIFEYLDDDCKWINTESKPRVINNLKALAEKLKTKSYECTIVQMGRSSAPIECNTKPDFTGQKVNLCLGFYNVGEICMVITHDDTYTFLKLELNIDGMIYKLFDTIPFGNVTPVNTKELDQYL